MACAVAACQGQAAVQPATRESDRNPYRDMTSDHGVATDALANGRWGRLPAAPIPDRDHPAGVWTGRELLVWGGSSGLHGTTLHGDGAAYDPARRAWRPLPPAPLTPRTGAAATWMGRELIVWGGYDRLGGKPDDLQVAADGAAYDPARDTWRRLPQAPLSARADATAVWTGREVLVVGGIPAVQTERDRGYTDGAAYDPARDAWRRMAPSPRLRGPLVAQHWVWTGTRLLVWNDWEQVRRWAEAMTGGQQGIREEARPGVDAWAYDPAADWWAVLAPAREQPALGGAAMVWTGREVLSVSGRPYHGPPLFRQPGVGYDPVANRWRQVADGPLDTAHLAAVLWTGAALLVWNGTSEGSAHVGGAYRAGDGAVWDPHGDRWVWLPRSPLGGSGAVAVWTGQAMLVWGGNPWPATATHSGMAFTPAGS